MATIRPIPRPAGLLAAASIVLAASVAAAPAASAERVPPPGLGDSAVSRTVVHTITVGGTPGWQITLIAIAAALAAAAIAVVLDRVRAARRGQLTGSMH
jgi:hypothetical protein